MKPIEQLKASLTKAMQIAEANISKAENFDLEDLSQVLERYIDELNDIGDFETYPDEIDEMLKFQKRAGIIKENNESMKLKELRQIIREEITKVKRSTTYGR